MRVGLHPKLIMPPRTIAIGDVHGCSEALSALLSAIDPRSGDTIVTLGDYVDRGPHSREAIEQLIVLGQHCRLIPLLGNHDEMLLQILSGHQYLLSDWLLFGGEATLASYESALPQEIPEEHIAFLRACRPWHESNGHFFVHGSYDAGLPLKKQPRDVLLWESIRDRLPGPHRSGKIAILGHTSQKNGEVFDVGYLKCIDTWVYGDGWLTAMDVTTGHVWQADKAGRLRKRGNDE